MEPEVRKITTLTPYLLAYEFSARLRDMLTADQMEAVARRNAANPGAACASHDFCDSNEVMIQALRNIDIEFDADDQEQADLTNAAWDIAKRHGFSVLLIGSEARAMSTGWPEPPVATTTAAEDLIEANRAAGPVESLLILPLIAALRDAVDAARRMQP
jgi:hypothetical protein